MLRENLKYTLTGLAMLGALAGCATPVEDLKPTTFEVGTLDDDIQTRAVTILHLMPGVAKVDNSINNDIAENAGVLTGALICGVSAGVATGLTVGPGVGIAAGVGGALICGVAGYWVGDAVEPPVLHPDTLIIVYQDPNDPQIKQAIEIARPCEFKPGPATALVISPTSLKASDIANVPNMTPEQWERRKKNARARGWRESKKEEIRIQPNNFQACVKYSHAIKATRAEDKAAKKIAEKEYKILQKKPNAVLPETKLPAGDVSRVDLDGTVLLRGKYLGVIANGAGSVLTLDRSRSVQISPDGVVRDRTDPKNEKILGQVPVPQLEQTDACKNNLSNCKFNHIGW